MVVLCKNTILNHTHIYTNLHKKKMTKNVKKNRKTLKNAKKVN